MNPWSRSRRWVSVSAWVALQPPPYPLQRIWALIGPPHWRSPATICVALRLRVSPPPAPAPGPLPREQVPGRGPGLVVHGGPRERVAVGGRARRRPPPVLPGGYHLPADLPHRARGGGNPIRRGSATISVRGEARNRAAFAAPPRVEG